MFRKFISLHNTVMQYELQYCVHLLKCEASNLIIKMDVFD